MVISWTERIPLDEDGIALIRNVAGVYKLIHYNPKKKKYIVHYVGQASDLNARLTKHLPDNEVNEFCSEYLSNYFCYFRAASISKQSDRDSAEVALYNEYKPDCVERIPDVNPIIINFE